MRRLKTASDSFTDILYKNKISRLLTVTVNDQFSVTYDLVSLLRDCYFRLSQNEIKYWLELVYQRLIKEEMINITFKEFETDFDLMGCQRHLKAIGIFSRLKHRDGKLNYMNDIPRTIHYLKIISNKYNFLKPLHNFINEVHSI